MESKAQVASLKQQIKELQGLINQLLQEKADWNKKLSDLDGSRLLSKMTKENKSLRRQLDFVLQYRLNSDPIVHNSLLEYARKENQILHRKVLMLKQANENLCLRLSSWEMRFEEQKEGQRRG